MEAEFENLERNQGQAEPTPNLLDIVLPAGPVPGFDVGWSGWTGSNRANYNPQEWLGAGYEGVRFLGSGRELSHVVPELAGSIAADSTVFVGRGCGIVRFEALTVHCATRKGIHVGFEGVGSPIPPLTVELIDLDMIADPPAPGRTHSTVWGLFTYNAAVICKRVRFAMEYSAEHAFYAHGFSPPGVVWENVIVEAAGAECCKAVCRPGESLWHPGCSVILRHCELRNWYQPHSWRGGAGLVAQGAGVNVMVSDTLFVGGDTPSRAKCIMVDSEPFRGNQPRHYGALTGFPGGSPANGWVFINRCGVMAGPGPSWYSPMIRCAPNGDVGLVATARGVMIKDSNVYGDHLAVQLANIENGRVVVKDCNTPGLHSLAQALGMSTVEAKLSYEGLFRDLSQGYP